MVTCGWVQMTKFLQPFVAGLVSIALLISVGWLMERSFSSHLFRLLANKEALAGMSFVTKRFCPLLTQLLICSPQKYPKKSLRTVLFDRSCKCASGSEILLPLFLIRLSDDFPKLKKPFPDHLRSGLEYRF